MKISKNASLLISGITSILFSRAMFALFNDPEGPNLLVVIGAAAIIYVLSLIACSFYPPARQEGLKRILILILIQAILVTGLYFSLR